MPSFFIPYHPFSFVNRNQPNHVKCECHDHLGHPPLFFAESARMCNTGTRGIDNGAGV